jgi:transcriptional regulator with XRE-family HTH domain
MHMTMGKELKELLKEDFTPSKKRIRMTQGEMLRIVRERNELSQNELAKLSGLTQSTISSIENNRVSLGVERAKALARVLGVHPAVLVFPDWGESAA